MLKMKSSPILAFILVAHSIKPTFNELNQDFKISRFLVAHSVKPPFSSINIVHVLVVLQFPEDRSIFQYFKISRFQDFKIS